MNTLKYNLAAVLAFSIWGTFSLVLKPLHAYSALDILFYRVFIGALVMSLITVLFKRNALRENLKHFRSLPRKARRSVAFLHVGSSILLAANWFSFIYVMNHISVRATSVAYLVCPIMTTILAFFVLKDRLTKLQWFSVMLSGMGCILLSYADMADMVYSSLIGFTYACYLVSQKKNGQFDKFLVLNVHILISALVLLPFFPSFSGPAPSELKFYFYVGIIAVVYTIIPLLLNLYALTGISSSKVGMILNINPIIAFVLAGVVYHEPLGALQTGAYALIFFAVLVFNAGSIFKSDTRKPVQ
ncbi:EamA family transporter [Chryseobacterium gregarium]|uniref:EamA family transporter n=1 Tax=Chryseobacterium gregarium TaxID=456299 RepID=UPI000428BC11|nr:EamA family transporter [Chryseobacterium gregarium]